MIEVSMITMNCATAMSARPHQRRPDGGVDVAGDEVDPAGRLSAGVELLEVGMGELRTS